MIFYIRYTYGVFCTYILALQLPVCCYSLHVDGRDGGAGGNDDRITTISIQ